MKMVMLNENGDNGNVDNGDRTVIVMEMIVMLIVIIFFAISIRNIYDNSDMIIMTVIMSYPLVILCVVMPFIIIEDEKMKELIKETSRKGLKGE